MSIHTYQRLLLAPANKVNISGSAETVEDILGVEIKIRIFESKM